MDENSSFVSLNREDSVDAVDAVDTVDTPKKPRSLARVWWGIAIGAVLAGLFIALAISGGNFGVPAVIVALFMFAFGASLTLEFSATREVMSWMCSKSISFPGLIWEFSFDGFLWLIGMKLLFWVVGVVFGIIVAIIGFLLGVLVAPFAYPFNLISYLKEGD